MGNNLIYRLKYRYGKHLPLKVPVDVSLELAAACNQRCGYCYWADPKGVPFPKGFMSYDIAEKILNQAAGLGVNSVKMNWKGESTLNKNFSKITGLAKNLASGSTFIDRLTNSNFKFNNNRDDIFEGLCNQTKVKISFDSFVADVMEKQRAGSDHALALANIEKFYNHKDRIKTETKIVIQAVRTSLNKDEDILGEAKRRWPDATVSIRDMVTGRVDQDLSSLENKSRDFSNRKSCLQAHVRVIFSAEGKAFPCCPDLKHELCIGDIRNDSLYEIFNCEKIKSLRRDLKSKKAFESSPCKTCPSFESYKGFKIGFNS